MARVAGVARSAFFAHPDWADHPTDNQGNPIVGRWIQPGEHFEVSDAPDLWRDQYGAYVARVATVPGGSAPTIHVPATFDAPAPMSAVVRKPKKIK